MIEFAIVMLLERLEYGHRNQTYPLLHRKVSRSTAKAQTRSIFFSKTVENCIGDQSAPDSDTALTNQLKTTKKPRSLTDKIDFAAFILFLSFYFLFNGIYVIKYVKN